MRFHATAGMVRHQPIPDWFADQLYEFACARGAVRWSDKIFRLAHDARTPGRTISSRRLYEVFERVRGALPWAATAQVSIYTVRNHAIAMIDRLAGADVAAAFADHQPADFAHPYHAIRRARVAQAVIDLHGGRHPWLETDPAK